MNFPSSDRHRNRSAALFCYHFLIFGALFPLFIQFAMAIVHIIREQETAVENGGNSSVANEKFEIKLCPIGCICEDGLKSMACSGLDLPLGIPFNWPLHLERLSLANCSIQTIERNAFRRFSRLREIKISDSPRLDLIDRHAFKLLKELRQLQISGNSRLKALYKGSFSAIGNEHLLSITIRGNAIEQIHMHAFRNIHNLRELTIDERCVDIENQAFSMFKVDFVTLRGICSLSADAFKNSSRVHSLSILDSSFSLQTKAFAGISHVNEIQLRQNKINVIESNAFAGLYTVGSVHMQSNYIERIQANAFANTENLGSLTLSYNTIRESLETEECLRNQAQRFVFSENTILCDCKMLWIREMAEYQQEQSGPSSLLSDNYCDREEQNKALVSYNPPHCPLPSSSSDAKSAQQHQGRQRIHSAEGNPPMDSRDPKWPHQGQQQQGARREAPNWPSSSSASSFNRQLQPKTFFNLKNAFFQHRTFSLFCIFHIVLFFTRSLIFI